VRAGFVLAPVQVYINYDSAVPITNTAPEPALPLLQSFVPPASRPVWIEHGAEYRFTLAQQMLYCLSFGGGPSKLRHQRVNLGDGSSEQRQRTAFSRSDCSASRLTDRARDNPTQAEATACAALTASRGSADFGVKTCAPYFLFAHW
jgi:hypothetical protein